MEVAAIIPTRGRERKIFSEWQAERARQMGYDKVYLVDYAPLNSSFDLYLRLAFGVSKAIEDGFEFVSVIEDDDYYSLNYLDTIKPWLESSSIVGINHTTYYHLFTNGWKKMTHPGRSSMFCTSFRTDLFRQLPNAGAPYHDLSFWRFVRDHDVAFRLIDKDIALGIKHGSVFGATGGSGHFMAFPNHDVSMRMLQARVDEESFKFYKEIKETFQATWSITGNFKR